MELRAAIVGCGRIGCEFDDDPRRTTVSTHAGAYTRSPEITLAALADFDEAKLRRYGKKYAVERLYRNCEEMLTQERPDILSVCTWNDSHLEIVQQAVQAGVRAIFCEKPIAESLASTDAIIKLCADQGVLLMVNHMRRFDPFHQEIRDYIRSGSLGRTQQVTCYYTAGLANTCTHLFDLLRFYLGDADWVRGIYSSNESPNPSDPNVDGWMCFEGDVLATLQACDVKNYLIFEAHILGANGRLIVSSSGLDLRYEAAEDSSLFSGYRELAPADPPINTDRTHEFMLDGVAHLVDCLKTGRAPLCDGEDGRKALEMIFGLRASADQSGTCVHLPLADSPIHIQSR